MPETTNNNSVRLVNLKFWTLTVFGFAMLSAHSYAAVTSGVLTGGSSMTNGGVFELIAAPAILDNNPYEDDNVRAFNEIQNFTLSVNLIMDTAASSLTSNVLGAGSVVSSHYIFFDPSSTSSAIGSITFDAPVVGVITSNTRFDESDSLLGNPGTIYAIGNQQLDNTDSVIITGTTIEFDLTSNSPGDAIRVITSNNPVPGINICATGTETLFGVITGGSALTNGGQFRQICDPVGPVGNDNFESNNLYAFEEQQAVELVADLFLDSTTVIPAGEFVSSFYVIWDPFATTSVIATITFPDAIIGVIGDQNELIASEFLGNASATYLNPSLLGLENGDTFIINGNELSIDFTASSPGDSIRVILGSASPSLSYNICEPQDETLSGSVTGGTAFIAGGTFSQLCEPIGPVGNNNFQSNDLFVFEEVQNFILTVPVFLDEPVMTVVPAGSEISSYYVAFDPSSPKSVIGSIDFPDQVLGVATSINNLNDTDFLGNATAHYLNPSLRGLEAGDLATFSGNVLSVNFDADSPGDYIRIFVGVELDETDGDGIADTIDNCILIANVDQRDTNGDGYGNVCDPDLDNNGIVNFGDYTLLVAAFLATPQSPNWNPDADFNGDDVVNFGDFATFPDFFLMPPGPSGTAP